MRIIILFGLCISIMLGCSSKSYIETSEGLTERTIDRKHAAKTRLTLALKYIELENYQAAKINLDKALSYHASDAALYLGYAYYYQRVNEAEMAESAYLKAIRLNSHDGNVYNNYGAFLCAQARYDEAETAFMNAISSPHYTQIANSYDNAGQCALKQKNEEKALIYFQSAYAYAPQNTAILLTMAELEYNLARYKRAYQLFSQYESVADVSSLSLWLGFKIANKRNRPAMAEKYSRSLLNKFPLSIQTKKYVTNDY